LALQNGFYAAKSKAESMGLEGLKMKHKAWITGALALGIAFGPVGPVAAGGSDIVGGVIGGIIGGAIVNEANRNRTTRTRTVTRNVYRAPSMSSAQREQNREVQASLNHFGWNVGRPDGVLGRNSRTGISQYQAFMDFPITGNLSELERTILTSAYQKARLGGSAVAQTISTHPQGMRGLLVETREQMLGGAGSPKYAGGTIGGLPPEVSEAVFEIARNSNVQPQQLIARSGFVQLADMNADGRTDYLLDTSVLGQGFWCNGDNCTVRIFASTPQGYERNDFQAVGATPAMFTCRQATCQKLDQTAPVMAGAPGSNLSTQSQGLPDTVMASGGPAFAAQLSEANTPTMPSFAAAVPTVSLASYCAKVGLVTSSNGGFMTEAAMSDADQALGEQFCLARGYAIDSGEAMAAKISGFTPDQVTAQCRDFGALLKSEVASAGISPRDVVIDQVKAFVAGSGMSPAQLTGTAKICLSVGYRTDDMGVAIGSALVLSALGQDGYGELIGHHLVRGIGTQERRDLALGWYEKSVTATPVFAPGQPERNALIRKAALVINGHSMTEPAPTATKGAVLPGFANMAADLVTTGAAQ
jgi:peptidoglycan hydrolase-like protein with peptidoglycan-binding domain